MGTQFVEVGNGPAKIIITKFFGRSSQFPPGDSHEVQQGLELLGTGSNHLLV
jgi:hypothetical protein